ncbi:MAG TPA: imidazole glycerol phosphate synthase subunit HisH [Thermoanaerobaculia bacterium]|nr:imidazole glycerol phosphate synthase subunit HisH [Thermoanaerobaculia bacterium]
MIVIVDYGMGNLGSILNMLRKIGAKATISRERAEIEAADKLVLPGVGAFDAAMRQLNESGLKDVLDEMVLVRRKPAIGLCLGMQLLTEGSEEGGLAGLGWIKGVTKRFRFPAELAHLKVPHMGWNSVRTADGKRIVQDLYEPSRFYFVHSYYVALADPADAAAWTHYGHDFVSIVEKEHIMGTQFHPEKSHKFGLRLLRNFAERV